MTASSMLEQELDVIEAKVITISCMVRCFMLLDYYLFMINDIDSLSQIWNCLRFVLEFSNIDALKVIDRDRGAGSVIHWHLHGCIWAYGKMIVEPFDVASESVFDTGCAELSHLGRVFIPSCAIISPCTSKRQYNFVDLIIYFWQSSWILDIPL